MSPSYPTPDALWQAALAELRLRMTQATYDAWLSGSHALLPVSSDQQLVVAVPSPYAPAWLTQRLGDLIHATLTDLTGRSLPIAFIPAGSVETNGQSPAILSIPPTPTPLQGATTMTNQPNPQAPSANPHVPGTTRVRIYSHVTQTRFLHIGEALAIGKLRLFGGTYRRNEGMTDHSHHFLDIADARVIFAALAGTEDGFTYKEYKGTPPGRNRPAVSRVLSVVVKGEKIYIELKTGPGKLTDTGAITPAGQPTTAVNISFKQYEAQRMAETVLAYLRAWDVLRMLTHKELVSAPPAYLLVPAVSEAELGDTANGRNGNGVQPVGNGTAVSVPAQPAAQKNGRVNGRATATMVYGDGTAVDAGNQTEVETFRRYLAARQAVPDSKEALLAYYRQVVE